MNRNVRPPAWGGGIAVPNEFQVTTLGNPLRVWDTKPNAMGIPLGVTIVGAVICAIGIAVAIFGPAPAAAVPFFIGSLLLGLGVYNLRRLGRAVRALVQYDAGFAVLVGNTVSAWPWTDVARIVSLEKMVSGQRMAFTERAYEVSKQNGETVALIDQHFEDVRAVIGAIKNHVGAHLLPPMQRAYDAGQPLQFGAVVVSRDYVEADGQRIAWGAIANVVVKDGRLVVTKKAGGALKVRVSKIPNIEQLGALIGVDPMRMDLTYF